GGFINISQSARKVVFVGSFSVHAQLDISAEGLSVIKDGIHRKFINRVEHRTFSGKIALANKQQVLYITERCVFELSPEGLKLVEIAPGIDLQRDILALMEFEPIMQNELALMDERIFAAKAKSA
ncbi:MAG: Acetyl-CoA:acetoacetyl-CoA transferase, alpha subunit (EC, partial [uncultured Thiotrichaceae bacterium]